jgi:hypothetical protein
MDNGQNNCSVMVQLLSQTVKESSGYLALNYRMIMNDVGKIVE